MRRPRDRPPYRIVRGENLTVSATLGAGLAVSAVCLAVRFEVLARRLGDGAQIGESA